jgi:hypothetical protein
VSPQHRPHGFAKDELAATIEGLAVETAGIN